MTTSTSSGALPAVELDTDTGFAVDYLLWQRGPGQYRVTVVCNVTFELRRGHSPVAKKHRPVERQDRYVEGDRRRALIAPADLVPRKAKAEVIVRGSVYSADATEQLDAKLGVSSVKKSIRVRGWRAVTADGAQSGAAPFKRMALTYEHAAASELNPVGMRPDTQDEYGRYRLPAIEGLEGGTASLDGLGPIAAHWPTRRKHLSGPAPDLAQLAHQPLPRDFDFGFFNAAPPDQRLPALSSRQSINLEHLHPQHRRMLTHLQEVRPYISSKGARGSRIPMKADTLLIDTDEGTATLTFRAVHPVSNPREPTKLFVGREAVTDTKDKNRGTARVDASATMDIELLQEHLGKSQPLPFGQPGSAPQRASHSRPGSNLPFQKEPDDPLASTKSGGWSANTSAPQAAWSSPAPSLPRPPTPSHRAPTPPPSPPAAPRVGSSPWLEPGAVRASAAKAPPPPPAVAPPAIETSPPAEDRSAFSLLWLEPDVSLRLRRNPAFKEIIDAYENRPVDFTLDDASDPMATLEDHREAFEVLAEGTASDGAAARTALRDATRDSGKFVPELRLLEAELSTPFEEEQQLRAMVAIAASLTTEEEGGEPPPLASAVARTRAFLDQGDDLVPGSIFRAHREKLEEAFEEHRTTLPPDYLRTESEAVLLARRKYQRRLVFGDEHLRTLLHLEPSDEPVPCYLPEELAKKLPLYRRFRVRMIAEIRRREDETEASALAIRPVVVARLLPEESVNA